ncbi:putative reverse transcriptase domain-containing protein [Tanacetum coccineum]
MDSSGADEDERAFQKLKQDLVLSNLPKPRKCPADSIVSCMHHSRVMVRLWRHYLYGTKCVVYTDHKSLQYILDQKELNMRQRYGFAL